MAENKQYITQEQENGCVLISEEVIGAIAARAITEVEGVAAIGTKSAFERKTWNKGIVIRITDNNELVINCHLVVAYGHAVFTVAQAAQAAASAAVESVTGIKPKSVNINVSGIMPQ